MPVLTFSLRTSLALLAVVAQIHLLFTYGVLPGISTTLALQFGLQVGAMLVAPSGYRWLAALLSGWVAAFVAIGLFLALFTLVAPFALIVAMSQGEFSGLWGVLGALAFLGVSASVVLVGFIFDQA